MLGSTHKVGDQLVKRGVVARDVFGELALLIMLICSLLVFRMLDGLIFGLVVSSTQIIVSFFVLKDCCFFFAITLSS